MKSIPKNTQICLFSATTNTQNIQKTNISNVDEITLSESKTSLKMTKTEKCKFGNHYLFNLYL